MIQIWPFDKKKSAEPPKNGSKLIELNGKPQYIFEIILDKNTTKY